MGNCISVSISFDSLFPLCQNCVAKTTYQCNLQDNLDALQTQLQKLIEARNDVMRRVSVDEQEQMKQTYQVQGWLSRVQAVEAQVGDLQKVQSQEIQKLCLGGYCSKNIMSSYKFGKKVAETLQLVATLKAEGAFEVVSERVPETAVDERPSDPTILGLQSTLDQVWRCLTEEQAGIIGLCGMGGVGKTTLLTKINNKFLDTPNNYDVVVWVVVSKDLQLEKIQETIGKKIGFTNESWKHKRLEEKAADIFKILRKKKFVLLLDDIWNRVDLTKVGVPVPNQTTASKLIFTTRLIDVCGKMEAQKTFRVECLTNEKAWELFESKVGKETLDSHPDIPELAKDVAQECGGLPLALITIGRAMAYKKTPEEWRYAAQTLRKSASNFEGMGNEVFLRLKFSYDSLVNDTIRSCFLYCSLFPEDYYIKKKELIDCWIGEEFLDTNDGSEIYYQGYHIIGVLIHACLLEEDEDEWGEISIKMHDVIRDMALWIACEIEKEKENFLVKTGMGLTEVPEIENWEGMRRISLMENKIENLPAKPPKCHHLRTLFLSDNHLTMINNDFFQFMPSLKVLNLSQNYFLTKLPLSISKLFSLQHLDLSWTTLEELSIELKVLVNLKLLNLEGTDCLHKIPRGLFSNFRMLHVLRMYCSGDIKHIGDQEVTEDSVLFEGGEVLVEGLLALKNLKVLTCTLNSSRALERFLSSAKLQNCTESLKLQFFGDSKSINILSIADLKNLLELSMSFCYHLEELTVEDLMEIPKTRQPYGFHSLQTVLIVSCFSLRDLTWLVFAPNLNCLDIFSCEKMEEIINVGKLGEVPEMMRNLNPFAKLQYLRLLNLPILKSFYWKALPFPDLKKIHVCDCPELKKLPFNSNSINERKIIIEGQEHWWEELQWEEETTQNAFLPCFKLIVEDD